MDCHKSPVLTTRDVTDFHEKLMVTMGKFDPKSRARQSLRKLATSLSRVQPYTMRLDAENPRLFQ